MPPTTVSSNLDTYVVHGVPLELLSQTFTDAIVVTKHLGYRYLWIDSLCIVQDDCEDWERESGRMADVYGNADLVIGATSAADSSCGFLGPRPDYLEGVLHLKGSQQRTWTVCYRFALPHNTWISNQEAFRPADEGPLELRGWAYQERVMARRYVSFGKRELCWECMAMLDCECCSIQGCTIDDSSSTLTVRSRVLPPRKYNLRRKLAQDVAPPLLRAAWRQNTVEPYCQRALSRPSDRLVAISASAAGFSKKLDDRYLAGIWSGDFREGGVSWYTTEPSTVIRDGTPSWSWASITGVITHPRRSKWKLDWSSSAEVLNIDYTSPPENPFGRPTRSSITLRGKVIHGVKLTYHPMSGYEIQFPAVKALALFMDTEPEPAEVWGESQIPIQSVRRRRQGQVATDSGDRREQFIEGLCCLLLAKPSAIILGLVSLQPRVYERLGFCILNVVQSPWEDMDVTLV